MDEAVTKWIKEGAPWLKYAVETQLLDSKLDTSQVVKDKSVSVVINRLKDNTVGIPALKTGKVAYTRTGNAFWDLYFLADIGLSAKELKIEMEIEEFFKIQLADGFSLLWTAPNPAITVS